MLNQNALNLRRAYPGSADLEHVVGPAIEPVVPVAILMELIAGTNPIALDGLLGSLVAVPLSRAKYFALLPQIAKFAGRPSESLVLKEFYFAATECPSRAT